MIYTLSFLTYYWYLQQVQLKNGLINVLEQQDVSLQEIKETVTKMSLITKGLSSSRLSRQMGKIVIIQNVTSGHSKSPFLLHSIVSIVPLYFCTLLKYSLQCDILILILIQAKFHSFSKLAFSFLPTKTNHSVIKLIDLTSNSQQFLWQLFFDKFLQFFTLMPKIVEEVSLITLKENYIIECVIISTAKLSTS